MSLDGSLREAMLAGIPILRAIAVAVCGRVEQADDLVQQALAKALTNIDLLRPGTNMVVWMCTFLHNRLGSEYRERRRGIEDMEGICADSMASAPAQIGRLEFKETRRALEALPLDQREALILVGVSDFSYRQAAEICGCPIGTAKSRVSRARARLAAILAIENVNDFDPKKPAGQAPAIDDLVHLPVRAESKGMTFDKGSSPIARSVWLVTGRVGAGCRAEQGEEPKRDDLF